MKNTTFALVLVCLLASCTTTKKINSEITTNHAKIQGSSSVKTDEQKSIVTDCRTTKGSRTSENVDTTFSTPGDTMAGEKSLLNLICGDSLRVGDASLRGIVSIDSLTHKVTLRITAAPRLYNARINRTTETFETGNNLVTVKDDLKSSATHDTTSVNDSKSDLLTKDVTRTTPWWLFVIVGGIVLIVIFVIVMAERKL